MIYPKIYLCLSFLLSLLFCFSLLPFYETMEQSVLFERFCDITIPIIFCLIIWFTIGKTIKIHPMATKIISHILYVLILLYQIFLIFALLLVIFLFSSADDKEYTDIHDYSKALECYHFESIEHFPKLIPDNAKNINFKRTPGGFLGDSTLFLQFDTNKEYIQNEINKYKITGREVLIDDKSNSKAENYDFDKERAKSTLSNLIDKEEGYKFKILDSGSCLKGFAFKNQNIIYVLYCD